MKTRTFELGLASLFAGIAVAIAAGSAGAAAFPTPMWLELDGAYYRVDPLQAISPQYLPDVRALVLPFTTASRCRRRDGGAFMASAQTLYYTAELLPVPLAEVELHFAPLVFRARSATHDVVCDGAVAGPSLFASGFEP